MGRTSFKPHEIEFMKAAEHARLATIQPDGTLQNNPVGFTYNEDLGTIDIYGYRMSKSRKFRNLASNNSAGDRRHRVPRPMAGAVPEIRGTAELAESAARRTEPDAEPHKLTPDSHDVPTTAD